MYVYAPVAYSFFLILWSL